MAMRTITTQTFTWTDITAPTAADIATLRTMITIHPLAIEEFATPTIQSRATQYPDGIFLAIHIPLFNTTERTTYPAEVDIIITDRGIVTGHTDQIYQLAALFEQLHTQAESTLAHIGTTPAHVFYVILDCLINSCFPRLDHITKNIDAIEDGVFHGNEARMVQEISIVKRDILNFRRTVMPQRSILESLLRKSDRFIGSAVHPYIQDLIGANIRLWHILESHKETIESLEDTNDTLLSNKLNDKLRILTLFSVILLPASLYATSMGINAIMPFETHPYGIAIHFIIMAAISLSAIGIFKWRRWL